MYDQLRLSNLETRLLFSERTELPRIEIEVAECGPSKPRLKVQKDQDKIIIEERVDETNISKEVRDLRLLGVGGEEEVAEQEDLLLDDFEFEFVELNTFSTQPIVVGRKLEDLRAVLEVRCAEFIDLLDREINEGTSNASMAASYLTITQLGSPISTSSPVTASIPSTPFDVSSSGLKPSKRRKKLAQVALTTPTPPFRSFHNSSMCMAPKAKSNDSVTPSPERIEIEPRNEELGSVHSLDWSTTVACEVDSRPFSLEGIALPPLPSISSMLPTVSSSLPLKTPKAQPHSHSVYSCDPSRPSSPIISSTQRSKSPTSNDLDLELDGLLSSPTRIPLLSRTPSLTPMSPLKRKFSSASYSHGVDDTSSLRFKDRLGPSHSQQKPDITSGIRNNQRNPPISSRNISTIEAHTAMRTNSGLQQFSGSRSHQHPAALSNSPNPNPNSDDPSPSPTPMLRRESRARSTSRRYSRRKNSRTIPQTFDIERLEELFVTDRMWGLEEGQEILRE